MGLMVFSLEKLATQAKVEAKTASEVLVAKDEKTRANLKDLAKSLLKDWELGIGAPPVSKGATIG